MHGSRTAMLLRAAAPCWRGSVCAGGRGASECVPPSMGTGGGGMATMRLALQLAIAGTISHTASSMASESPAHQPVTQMHGGRTEIDMGSSTATPQQPGAVTSTKFGSWHRYLPLLDTVRSSTVQAQGNMTATILALKETNQLMFGLDASSCSALQTFGDFLHVAEELYPELRVFACLSSHSPIHEYCSEFADQHGPAVGQEVNWTRTGELIARQTVGTTNFHGLYIDDWYVIMCSAQTRTYVRHGSTTARPCHPMSDMMQMRNAMRAIQPTALFMPLVYHDQLGLAIDGGFAIGAGNHVPFNSSDSAVLTFPIQTTQSTRGAAKMDTSPAVLTFFYKNMLSVWTRTEGPGKTAGQVYLDVVVDGKTVQSIDTALDPSVVMVNLTIDSVPRNVSFATRAPGQSDPGTLRLSYVFGLELRSASSGTSNLIKTAAARFSVSKSELTASSTSESVATGTADAIIALQSQNPAAFVLHNYTALMKMISGRAAQQHTVVYAGHYARNGLKWTNAVDATQLESAIAADAAMQIPASLVWQSPLSLLRCRSETQRCDEGSFAERILPPAEDERTTMFTKVLEFPTNYIFEPGWYSRSTTANSVSGVLTVILADSQRAKGIESYLIHDDHFFRKRVYGTRSNVTYYQDYAGHASNGSVMACSVECPGADAVVHCERSCSGIHDSIERLALTVGVVEPVAVELSLQRDVSHTPMSLRVGVLASGGVDGTNQPQQVPLVFEAQVHNELHPSSRAVFNATLSAWGASVPDH